MAGEHYGEEGGWSIPNERKFELIAGSIDDLKGKKVLDLGCGVGNYTAKLKELGFDVEGADIEKSKIDIARKKHPGINFFLFSEKTLNKKYDAVIAIDVIEHVKEYGSWLLGISSALNEKGRLVIATPNIFGLNSYLKLLLGDGSILGFGDDPESRDHVRFFSKATLRKAVEENGFKVLGIKTFSQNSNLLGKLAESVNKAGLIVAVCEKA